MKPKYFLLLFLTLTIIHQTSSIATIRYVSKTGTSTFPYTSWLTSADSIQKCINVCVAGDTVYVANGVYHESLVVDKYLSLSGSSMDSTIVDGTGLADKTLNFVSVGNIENFNIYGKGPTGACIWANEFIEIKNCRLSNTGIGVVIFRRSSIVNNIIMKNLTRAYDAGCLSGSCTNFLTNCIILLDRANSMGVLISIGGDYYINNNIILFTGTVNQNPGTGISIGAPRSVYINNNLISGFWYNIFVDDPLDTIFIKNNVLVNQNATTNVPATIRAFANHLFISNVVLSKNRVGIRGDWKVRSNYNLFWKNQVNLEGVTMGDSDIVADPMFVKDTIPTASGDYDFHLQAYSPAIDKGNPDVLDLDGTRSDIGLFGGPYGEIYTYQDLAPKPPANLTAAMDSGLVHLKWNKNTEADFFRYRVYRDTVPDFVYDTIKIIAVVADSFYYDDPPQKYITGNYYYKITALDNTSHQSAASEEVHINITGIPEAPPIVVEHYRLLNNYPNPFNPSTTIPYRLKEAGYVKVMVYNILGEMVRVLVNKYQGAGYYEVLFSPDEIEKKRGEEGFPGMETWYHSNYVSGVYLYRIEVIGEGNIPVFTDMKKMMLVK